MDSNLKNQYICFLVNCIYNFSTNIIKIRLKIKFFFLLNKNFVQLIYLNLRNSLRAYYNFFYEFNNKIKLDSIFVKSNKTKHT